MVQDAFRELSSAGGPVGNLAAFIKPYLREGQDAEDIARTFQKIGIDVAGAARRGPGGSMDGPLAALHFFPLAWSMGSKDPIETLQPQGLFGEGSGLGRDYMLVPPEQIAQLTQAAAALTRLIEDRAYDTAPSVGIQHNYGPDARSRRKLETHGQTVGRSKE